MTVFLSLTLTVLLSLILTLLHGARVGAVCMETEIVADIAANSVLAEFSKALFEQYDLLLVDASYGEGQPSVANVEEHFRYYADGNFMSPARSGIFGRRSMTALESTAASIEAYSVATDNAYAVLKRQILEYMTAEPVEAMLAELGEQLQVLQTHGIHTADIEEEIALTQDELAGIELPVIETEDGEETEAELDNPADAVWNENRFGLVDLLIPDGKEVSPATVDLSKLPSHRALHTGTGLSDELQETMTDRLLINLYLSEKCACFGRTADKSVLKYQMEYLIAGKANDHDNLSAVAYRLLLWREASNLAYLMSSSTKMAAVEALADTVAILTLMPQLRSIIKYSIILAWTFAESVADLRALYKGEKVPLLKSDDTWRMSIEHLADYKSHLDDKQVQSGGLKYDDYLKLLLFFEDETTTMARFCDLMELDVHKAVGNNYMKLDYCMDCFSVYLESRSRFGISAGVRRTVGYEMY